MQAYDGNDKMRISEMLSYGGAQFSTAIYMAFSSYYLMMFFTDIAMISPAVVAVMLFCYRIFCAADTQVVGLFINRKSYKDGKYRPYFKLCAIPFAISIIVLGITPSIPFSIRILFAALAIILCDLCWSVLHTAAISMLPYLATDDISRTKIMSFSNSSSIIAFILVGSFTLPLVNLLGGGDRNKGFLLTLTIFAIIIIPLYLNAYFKLNERFFTESEKKPVVKDIFIAIGKSRRVMVFFAGYCIYQIADTFKNLTTYYYMTYVMERPDFMPVVMMAGLISPLMMQPVIPRLLNYVKKEVLIVFGLFAAAGACVLMFIAGHHPYALLCCIVLYGFSTAITANLVFAVVASFSDEMRANNDMNMSEILTAVFDFSSNVGVAVAGGIAATTLAWLGYSANASSQSPGVLTGIRMLYIVFTAFGLILSGVMMLIFRKYSGKQPVADKDDSMAQSY